MTPPRPNSLRRRLPAGLFAAGSLLAAVALVIALSARWPDRPALAADAPAAPQPIRPLGADGKPLNLDFEDGTLKDWTATGDAFDGQPIKGDTVASRRSDMRSGHQGNYWVGGYEIHKDDATGTLTSVPFQVTHRWASFLLAGGSWPNTRVELATADDNKVFFKQSGSEDEELRPVVVDLEKQKGRQIVIRLVDQQKGGWGHVNFDNFAFYDEKPTFKNTLDSNKPAEQPSPGDVVKFAGLKPEEAAKAMTLPPGFKATLFAGEPDVVQPIAFTIDARGRLWVVQGMTYPKRQPDGEGKDSILVFEDKDGDGKFDKRTVFMEGLNLVSGIEIGFGGVWVGAAPYLMFIPCDEMADEPKPTGETKILLDGFGYGDTHETLNTFTWGPDGWLYGCHGVFTEAKVGKPGTPDKERVHLNAGIFRYHPTKHIFERFAEGTSNPWGIDFDEHGQCIIEACVIPHLWHMIQGARYERQGGNHDNPYTFADIKTIADHVHYTGSKGPHAGNGRSDAAGGGHAHAGLLVYQGNNWPAEFRGKVFMNNIHGSRINMDVLEPQGSGFVGHHGKDFCLFNDSWSQIVNLRTGPDGGVYLIDWYDKNQCHNNNANVHDRTNGRIFKITYGTPERPRVMPSQRNDLDLFRVQGNESDWHARTARRLMQERAASGQLAPGLVKSVWKIIVDNVLPPKGRENNDGALRYLWAAHVIGGFPGKDAPSVFTERAIGNRPYFVGWMIQLSCEDGHPSAAVMHEFVRLAKEESSPVVRLYLASAVLRIPVEQRADILAGLLSHSEDAGDHNLPLVYWYGLESICGTQPDRALAMALETKIPNVLSFTVRRLTATGGDAALASLVGSLNKTNDAGRQAEILRGLNAGLKGRRGVAMPAGWEAVEAKLLASADGAMQSEARALAVTFGSKTALESARKTLADAKAPADARKAALESLAGAKDPALAPVLQGLLADPALRGPAVRALAGYDDPNTPKAVIAAYPSLTSAERKDALVTLASRAASARELLAAVEKGTVDRKDLSADIVRQLRALKDADVDKAVTKAWGVLRDSPADKLKRIQELRDIVNETGKQKADLPHGRLLFTKTCAQCHTLFDAGGKVGPDITGSDRGSLAYLLENVVDPNALIPADYAASVVDTKDNRTIVGIVKKQDEQAVTVMTQNETLTLPRGEIAKIKPSDLSMMPEGLLDKWPREDVRDLVAYLRGSGQVALPAGAETGAAEKPAAPNDDKNPVLFNGKDLTGWDTNGVEGLWSVDNGELVGKTEKGLKENQFITTKESYGDFRLVVKIKLVPNGANSGIQFHSDRFGKNEMSGPQADAGKGWWGKVYGENFGNKVIGESKSGEDIVHADEWNTYEVVAVGPKILTAINGKPCTDIEDPKYVRKGMFGLQVHSGGPTEVRFKDFELELNPKAELKTVK